MPELPEGLKKYLPLPLSLTLTLAWWVGSDAIKEFAQQQLKPIPARIRVENKKNNLHVVHVEITRETDKAFEEVQIELRLQAKPTNLNAELFSLDGTRAAVAIAPTKKQDTIFFIDHVSGKNPPITIKPRESVEISFEEASPVPVAQVWLNSKDRRPIALTDLNQRWPIAEIGWRALAVVFAVVSLLLVGQLLIRLLSKKAQKQLEEDVEFLHRCGQADKAALTKFQADFQPLVDVGTGKYLKAVHDDVREPARSTIIPHEIFRRAESLPQLRRSLKGEVQKFVITFCVEMLEHEYKTVKAIGKADRSRIP